MNFRFPIFKLALLALMIAVLAPNPASAQSQAQWNSLYDRIIRVEAAVRNMQGQTHGQAAPVPQNAQGSAQLNLRISSLEDQVRQLLGSMERLTRDLQQSRQDNEVRLRRLETAAREGRLRGKFKKYADAGSRAGTPSTGGSSAGTLTLAPLPNQSGGTTHSDGLKVYDQGSLDSLVQEELVFESEPILDQKDYDPNTSGSGVTGTTTQIAPGSNGSNSSRVQAPGPTTLGTITMQGGTVTGGSVNTLPSTRDVVEKRTLGGDQVASLTTGSGPELVYEQAYDNMLGRRFGAAEAGFEQFLSQHKRHKLAAKAQYWLGETHYARKDYPNAARAFLLGYKTYKKNAMAPVSLVKLGMSLRKMGQKEQACATFSQVKSEFPKAKAERKLAGKESRRAGC